MAMIYPTMRAAGPPSARIMLIGEAPGVEEMMQGTPFVGKSGKELGRMLESAGLDLRSCYRTNVFHKRPSDNKIENFTDKGPDLGIPGMPALFPGKYINQAHADELERLYDEIDKVRPNVICALGNTPCWAILKQTPKITALRGRITQAEIRGRTYKVLPAFHPAYILRNWKDRVITIADFQKLKRESRSPELRLPERWVLVDPTYDETMRFFHDRVFHSNEVATDVETFMGQITVAGVAVSPSLAIVVPFVDFRRPGNSYWSSAGEEWDIIELFRRMLAERRIVKILQNGMYDLAYFVNNWKARPQNLSEDTMILQHAMWPELKKGLADLASIHTDEASWKMMRLKNRDDIKRDE